MAIGFRGVLEFLQEIGKMMHFDEQITAADLCGILNYVLEGMETSIITFEVMEALTVRARFVEAQETKSQIFSIEEVLAIVRNSVNGRFFIVVLKMDYPVPFCLRVL